MTKSLFPLPYFLSSFYVVVKLGRLATTILFQPTLPRKRSFDVLGTCFSWDILGNLGKQFKYTLNISKRISGESHKSPKETYGNKFGHECAWLSWGRWMILQVDKIVIFHILHLGSVQSLHLRSFSMDWARTTCNYS